MVRKYTDGGYPYDEPPYTEEELMALYRSSALGPGSRISVIRPKPSTPAAADPAAKPDANRARHEKIWRPGEPQKVDYMGFWITVSGPRRVEEAGKPASGRFTWAIRRYRQKKIMARGASDDEYGAHMDARRAVHETIERGE
jgi:hypothetical protein